MVVQLLSPTKSASARRAVEAFKKLQALTEDEAARKELADAGVSSRRINSLYPNDFIARIPAICEHLGRANTDEVFSVSEAIRQLSAHVGLFPTEVGAEFQESLNRFYAAPEFERLKKALNDRFPLPQSQDVGEASLTIVAAYSFWMMERRGQLGKEETLQGVYELFFQTYTYLIPELAA